MGSWDPSDLPVRIDAVEIFVEDFAFKFNTILYKWPSQMGDGAPCLRWLGNSSKRRRRDWATFSLPLLLSVGKARNRRSI